MAVAVQRTGTGSTKQRRKISFAFSDVLEPELIGTGYETDFTLGLRIIEKNINIFVFLSC
jgi:hypothetical protein